ncbi:phosphohistidine phosphatase SixA, putative [hydrothermal vent metagenome]|uniref:Phosphohistidine phosphatase SixA, putative n=1 Tax=hydrothermal vent metagenome TaxID=652676 RepID=A0A1W1BAH6_9ZZZZ
MKRLYLIRHAKAEDFLEDVCDFERELSKRGQKEIKTISSYLKLQEIKPDAFFSSCALYAQQTSIEIAKRVEYKGKITFFKELYKSSLKEFFGIITVLDDSCEKLIVVAHNPQLNELVNKLSKEHIKKLPKAGVVALSFDIDSWSEIDKSKAKLEFFIYPKQFRYYMPKHIRTTLPR